MNDLDKRIRRSAIGLVVMGFLAGLLIGFIVGVNQGDTTVVIPLTQGVRT